MAIPPAVPPKKDLIRTSMTAAHTDADLEKIAGAMAAAARGLLF
jgi:8-amino-7-oxononanoate synthase